VSKRGAWLMGLPIWVEFEWLRVKIDVPKRTPALAMSIAGRLRKETALGTSRWSRPPGR
jgi:hypothetical protein